ncbi:energy-coupling factor transporter transmembrane component T [Isobaculum melis]|uniref:Energy-coupling factor transport system permease protein n=1 Tax=Isobaculum melis TaxID=142588 RepID=A0A1H9U464_9LACT|nr:energy-coupling factor transporter transmembrane component T [Isobaculum melis]SES04112.1 energy-coupling factor transport system permease protein [Isobaculum melis]
MHTVLNDVHPITSFCYYIGVMILSMMFLHPVFLIGELFLFILYNICQHNGAKMKQMFKGAWFFIGVIVIVNPLLNHQGTHHLFYIGRNPITLEAIIYGGLLALSFCCLMFIFLSYNLVITSHKFLYLFSRISPQLALLTMITMRFVPLFIRRLTTIKAIQKTRGIQMDSGNIKTRARNGMHLVQILLVCSLEEALQTADSMEARGYGVKKRSSYLRYHMEKRDIFSLILGAIILGICIYGKLKGFGDLQIYPSLGSFGLKGIEDVMLLILTLLFTGYPLILEGREWLWWRWQK